MVFTGYVYKITKLNPTYAPSPLLKSLTITANEGISLVHVL